MAGGTGGAARLSRLPFPAEDRLLGRSTIDLAGEGASALRIAIVSPLHESVERVVSYLTEELVRLGHDVTLFATADSVTAARLHAMAPRALRLQFERHGRDVGVSVTRKKGAVEVSVVL